MIQNKLFEQKTILVVPCFNESNRWKENYWTKIANHPSIEIVFVNDGSSDLTLDLIKRFSKKNGTNYVNLPKNSGKAEATRLGLIFAISMMRKSPEIANVGFIDADGSSSINEVLRIVEIFCLKNEFDSLWTSRVKLSGREINRTLVRHFLGRIFALIASIGTDTMPYDTQSGFKLFKLNSKFENCVVEPFKTRWLFELEILNRWEDLNKSKLKIWEEPLMDWKDIPGSKVTFKEILRVGKELLLLKTRHLSFRKLKDQNGFKRIR
jgi:dolichyl-phosphate beta-glucosyltransferase